MNTIRTSQVTEADVAQFKADLPGVEKLVADFEKRASRGTFTNTGELLEEEERALASLKEYQGKCLALLPVPDGYDLEPLPIGALDLFVVARVLEERICAAWRESWDRLVPQQAAKKR